MTNDTTESLADTTGPADNLVLGVIRIPTDRTRFATNILLFSLILLYYPGSMLVEAYDVEVFGGWTLLLLWIIFIGPILMTALFIFNAHHRIGFDASLSSEADVEEERPAVEEAEGGDQRAL